MLTVFSFQYLGTIPYPVLPSSNLTVTSPIYVISSNSVLGSISLNKYILNGSQSLLKS